MATVVHVTYFRPIRAADYRVIRLTRRGRTGYRAKCNLKTLSLIPSLVYENGVLYFVIRLCISHTIPALDTPALTLYRVMVSRATCWTGTQEFRGNVRARRPASYLANRVMYVMSNYLRH